MGTTLSLPFILGLSPVIGCAIGWGIDRLLGTKPLFTVVLLLAGVAAGVRESWRQIQRILREQTRDDKDRTDHP